MLYIMEASELVVAETEAADLSKKEAVGTDDSDQVDNSNEPDKEADDDLEDGEITDDDEEEDEAATEQSHAAENEDKEPPVHDHDGDRSDGGSESSRQEDRGSNRHHR